jgi:hypothetical protein
LVLFVVSRHDEDHSSPLLSSGCFPRLHPSGHRGEHPLFLDPRNARQSEQTGPQTYFSLGVVRRRIRIFHHPKKTYSSARSS